MFVGGYTVIVIGVSSLLFFFFQAEDGIRDAQESRGLGDVYKRQVVDIKAKLIDGSFHEVDSSEMAFKIAGSMAIKDAVSYTHLTLPTIYSV